MVKPLKKRKAVKRFNYDKNRRREWKKMKKLPAIKCKQIKEAWDPRKSVHVNMKQMGLSSNPNKTLKIPKTKELMGPEEDRQTRPKRIGKKIHVMEALEKQANQPFDSTLKLPESDRLFCVYMLDKYGDDYKAMARDYRNYYQETPKQIKKKINLFKNTPAHYQAYLKAKEEMAMAKDQVRIFEESPDRKTDHSGEGHCLQCLKLTRKRGRPVTRRYEAARRNGHYTLTPPVTPSKQEGEEGPYVPSVSLHKVRRRLQFGRKPPRIRCVDNNTEPSPQPVSSDQASPLLYTESLLDKSTSNTQKEVTAPVKSDGQLLVNKKCGSLDEMECSLRKRLRSSVRTGQVTSVQLVTTSSHTRTG